MYRKTDKGVITLEACVTVFAFILLMLLLSGLFKMFMAQNLTAHAVLQTSESLSLDVYAAEKVGTGGSSSVSEVVVSIGDFISNLFDIYDDGGEYFATNEKWYDAEEDVLKNTVKTRFVGYLVGSVNSEDSVNKADEFLRRLNVKNGLDGIDFSESYIANGTLYIVLTYELEYDFNIGDLGTVNVRQTTSSKLWK